MILKLCMIRFFSLLFCLKLIAFSGCRKPLQAGLEKRTYETKHVVVVVIDGPRYSETWGSETKELVPRMAQEMAIAGVINENFRNAGPTYTNAGHIAITTGVHQHIDNGGRELPKKPSYLQLWLEKTGKPASKAWIVTSKDKLHILADTEASGYYGKFRPEINCGINGPGTGYRSDSVTLRTCLRILKTERPDLMLVNFKEPDSRGHAADWEGYLKGIRDADEYVYRLWQFLQQDAYYRNTTTLLVTNDHGRHADGHRDGFVSHGDGCRSCRKLNFYAAGPDFKQNEVISESYNQTDIPVTIAELLGFEIPHSKGRVMWELFR